MKRVALITGGRRGIGYGVAQALAEAGVNLVINDIAPEAEVRGSIEQLAGEGVDVLYSRADISSSADRDRLLSEAFTKFDTIHILVNNAGVAPEERMDILSATERSFERVMRINLQGPYFLTQSIANHMIRQKGNSSEEFFCIVNIASSNSQAASIDRGEYCISKAGVSMASKLWAARLGEYDIPVYEIRPGIIKTDMTSGVTQKYDRMIEEGLLLQPRWGLPGDVGRVVRSLARGEFVYSTGQVFYIDGGQLIQRL
ncbi:MAG TPA: 3-ketoacyl-ACP reductase [bacterium]|nr:3-ketoacyl-ACP reductase [bacterium]